MDLSERVQGRLVNWKFRTAFEWLTEDGAEDGAPEYELVGALAEAFDNPGWFGGHLGTIVAHVVATLVPPEDV